MIHNLRNAKKWMTLFLSAVLVMQPPLASVSAYANTVSGNDSYVDILDADDSVEENAQREATDI